MAVISSNPTMQDLKLTIKESTLISPLEKPEKKSFFLSNIDQILNYNVPTFYVFQSNPDYPPEDVSKRLKLAVQRVLVPYDFMAGRLKLNEDSGRLEIDCNSAGAGFVVAASEFSLEEIGDLVCPNVGFQQLAAQKLDNLGSSKDDQPLFILQVTLFRCGGFAIGLSVNHILLDGISAKAFNENLASQAFDDKPLAVVPFLNRRLLSARSPPQVAFNHPEFFKPDLAPLTGPPVFDCKKEELVFKVFQFSPKEIIFLKEKATTESNSRISSLSVVVALIWRCKALSKDQVTTSDSVPTNYDKDRVSTILNVLDLRPRLNPPLPPTYCGNPLLVAYAAARCEDLEKQPFSEAVKMVAEGPARVTDEYAKSVIDWLEINKGLPCGEYMVSSWLKLGFEEVVFPWGKAHHTGPVVNHRKDICWVFPTDGGVINALVSLPPPEMERFESLFRQFFVPESCAADRSETTVEIQTATATMVTIS